MSMRLARRAATAETPFGAGLMRCVAPWKVRRDASFGDVRQTPGVTPPGKPGCRNAKRVAEATPPVRLPRAADRRLHEAVPAPALCPRPGGDDITCAGISRA